MVCSTTKMFNVPPPERNRPATLWDLLSCRTTSKELFAQIPAGFYTYEKKNKEEEDETNTHYVIRARNVQPNVPNLKFKWGHV